MKRPPAAVPRPHAASAIFGKTPFIAWRRSIRKAKSPAGIDGYIEIRDLETDAATGLSLAVQSKATGGRFTAETERGFEYPVSARDLEYWLSGNLPILLVVSRPGSGEAYYKSLKEYFSDPDRRRERRVIFDKEADRFDESASAKLASLARPRDSGLHVRPVPNEEEMFSNLLPIRHFPKTVYHTETDYRNPARIWSEVKEKGLNLSGDWILHGKRLWSVRNPEEGPLRRFCQPTTTEPDEFPRWAQSDDRELGGNFARLLYQCLRERLRLLRVGYNTDKSLYYFWAPRDLSKKKVRYRHHAGSHPAHTVFRGYPEHSDDPEKVHFYRHMAFEGFFKRIDGD